MQSILNQMDDAALEIYDAVRKGLGLQLSESENESGDEQIELDIFADEAFRKRLSANKEVRFVLSEEQPNLAHYSDGQYSVALDPLDGSKSALVGIPSGAIFGVFENASTKTDFCGKNIVAGGFYVFGATLECFSAIGSIVQRRIYQQRTKTWEPSSLPSSMPSANFFAVNVSNFKFWPTWLREHYKNVVLETPADKKPANIRWYASMVSEIKRLVLEGGIFAYPANSRTGYENGRLRLVYEAIPMAYLVEAFGGASSDGTRSLLELEPQELHQKIPVFLGELDKIKALQDLSNDAH